MNAGQDPDAVPAAYRGNPLIEACGPILSPESLVERLFQCPPLPTKQTRASPPHVLKHELFSVRRLHVPSPAGVSVAQTMDFLRRQGYVHRNPAASETWRRIYSGTHEVDLREGVQLAASTVGLSGAGKSTALQRGLMLTPQVVVHERFPGLVGPVRQLLWLKIDVPPSGTLRDLIESFALATDEILGTDYLSDLRRGRRRSPHALTLEWMQRMACHFPGLLVLDEIQNLFKIERKDVRRKSGGSGRPLLRVVDDEALKMLLTLTNACKFPLVVCGTPDGIGAFGTRMSTSQRLITGGFHRMEHAVTAQDSYFRGRLLPMLFQYQWLPRQLELTDSVASLIHQSTAGLPRLIASLWIQAQRQALEDGALSLSEAHLRAASLGALAPVQPAVRALLSEDPRRMELFEDLLPRGDLW